jgi:hypothetical protein
MGFDSLMAVDLKLALEDRLGRALPPLPLGEGVSCTDLARRILAGLGSAPPEEPAGDEAMARLVAQHVGGAVPDAAFLARVIEDAERGVA